MNLWDTDWGITIPALIGGFGVVVGVVGACWYALKKRRLARWTKTKGRVECYETLPAEGDGFYYNPRIVFSDTFGRDVRFGVEARWNNQVFEVGGEIPVRFDPSNPYNAVIDQWSDSYAEVIVLYIFSGFLITGAIGMACFFRSTK
ncbi:DUF3592 domain-containing protein [Opitutus sp. GAS368]|uniref:DUF3592 domain-containing protein n=1 Tax=Opitutus sp. GAS368 TaxID=1882749 RepID=UPI000B84772D|nr:DUF3592 domain-containing protein [Opitutus sp. GAS368]